MQHYGVREVEKLLRLPRSTIRTLVHAGFVSPERGPRNAWRFSFRDLIALRTAQALVDAKVPARRIARAMRELRVVKEGSRRWQAESGQYLLSFEGDLGDGSVTMMERKRPRADELLERANTLEEDDAPAAIAAYREAIEADGRLVEAYVNLGRLLHAGGRLREAEIVYRNGIAACGEDSLLLYNLGVALADAGRKGEAIDAYEAALRVQPRFADCHYNLALLCEELQKPRDAIRHMAQYRRLTRGSPD